MLTFFTPKFYVAVRTVSREYVLADTSGYEAFKSCTPLGNQLSNLTITQSV